MNQKLKRNKVKSPWLRGYDWIMQLAKTSGHPYNIHECRIAAMSYEVGWKAAKRDSRKKGISNGRV